MIYAKITELKDRYMIYNAVKNERKWRNKKLDLDEDELIATRDGGKCEYCNEDEYDIDCNFIQDNKNKQIIFFPTSSWEANKKLHINYCPMCGKKLK